MFFLLLDRYVVFERKTTELKCCLITMFQDYVPSTWQTMDVDLDYPAESVSIRFRLSKVTLFFLFLYYNFWKDVAMHSHTRVAVMFSLLERRGSIWIIWNSAWEICLLSPTYLFIQSLIYIIMDPQTFIYFTLDYNPLLYVVVQIVPVLTIKISYHWLLCSFDIPPLLQIFVSFWALPYFLTLQEIHSMFCITWASPRISHLSDNLLLLLLENGLRNQIRALVVFFTFEVSLPAGLSADRARKYLCVYWPVNIHISIHIFLENPMDRGTWWTTVHGVTKSWTWLSN